jgi:hypothetical protein
VSARAIGLLGWAVVVGVAVAIQVVATRREGRPTLGTALDALVSQPLARWALLLGWVAVGLHLFVWPPMPP